MLDCGEEGADGRDRFVCVSYYNGAWRIVGVHEDSNIANPPNPRGEQKCMRLRNREESQIAIVEMLLLFLCMQLRSLNS